MAIKSTTLTLRLGPRLREELEQAAYDEEMALGEFVRFAVNQYLQIRANLKEDPTSVAD